MLILTGVFILSMVLDCSALYEWDKSDHYFDCIVAIEKYYSGVWYPMSMGVYIRKNLIVSTIVPAYENSVYTSKTYVQLHAINGNYRTHTTQEPTYLYVDPAYAVTMNWDIGKYLDSPVSDIILFKTSVFALSGLHQMGKARIPIYFPIAKKYTIEEPSEWRTAAFALTDEKHVRDSTKLVPVYYNEPVLVDCHELLPKNWGLFICIMNIDHYPVIQSGAPLIQNGLVFGVASFSLRKGKDDVFVFTDLREYREIVYGKVPE